MPGTPVMFGIDVGQYAPSASEPPSMTTVKFFFPAAASASAATSRERSPATGSEPYGWSGSRAAARDGRCVCGGDGALEFSRDRKWEAAVLYCMI